MALVMGSVDSLTVCKEILTSSAIVKAIRLLSGVKGARFRSHQTESILYLVGNAYGYEDLLSLYLVDQLAKGR